MTGSELRDQIWDRGQVWYNVGVRDRVRVWDRIWDRVWQQNRDRDRRGTWKKLI